MPSPFPGMDPYLEDREIFPNLHHSLIFLMMEVLNHALPRGYVAGSATRVWVDRETQSEPDVSVFTRRDPPEGAFDPAPYRHGGMVAVATTARASDPFEEAYLQIRSGRGRRLVTHVEVVSPSNKASGKAREMYQAKQTECHLGGVNMVEIDLLRHGKPVTSAPPGRLRAAAGAFDYHVCVTAAEAYPDHYVYPIRLPDRLPDVPVPLDPPLPPVIVGLQALMDRCYDAGRYGEVAEYARACEPPLTPDQAAWAAGVLAAHRGGA